MAALSNAFLQALEDLTFLNSNIANVGDATGLRGSSTAGSLYCALHTANPGASGNQTTNECAYTSYARQPVARSGSGWTRSGGNISPTSDISFPTCTGGTETATHGSVGTSLTGTGMILFFGAISPTISISTGVIPKLTTSSVLSYS